MKNLLDYDIQQLKTTLQELGVPIFRATQLYQGIIRGKNIDEINTLPKNLKELLLNKFVAQPLEVKTVKESADGAKKIAFRLADGNIIESVIMPYKYGHSLCVSTQVGCNMKCVFCASGEFGKVRDLTAGEILAQVVLANSYLGGALDKERMIKKIVLMGSGEPLENYDEVIRFLYLVGVEYGLNIGSRNISLSTCGIPMGIRKLADSGENVTLGLSLHASTDKKRIQIMPIAKKYKLNDVISACRYYFEKTGRRIIIEYVVIKNFNDTMQDVMELRALLKGLNCHVNLIRLNRVENSPSILKAPTKKDMYSFQALLEANGISATVRRSLGNDIEGACGQLRKKMIDSK